MPAKLGEVTDKVAMQLIDKLKEAHPDHHELIERIAHSFLLADIGRLFFEGIGLGVANDGEIYNPAPPPRPSTPRTNGAHWSGGKRRR